MLVLSRHRGEKIYIGANIVLTIVDVDRGKVRVGIECPRDIAVWREELMPKILPKLPEKQEHDPYHPEE